MKPVHARPFASPIVVQKFGGTSLATPDLIAKAAQRALAARARGHAVVIVVSAMAGETDRLLTLARSFVDEKRPFKNSESSTCVGRELDVIAATGEQVSAGLMALAIRAGGAPARSWLAHQLPIRTSAVAASAEIESIDVSRIYASLAAGEVPVVAGFQGIDVDGNLTTLGRGGSDTTAVALAASLGATCEIYTDVDGVYTLDPRICPRAVRLTSVGYKTMEALSESGAKVLETRCVRLAMDHAVPVHVRSAFCSNDGTWLTDREVDVLGIATSHDTKVGVSCAKISVIGPHVDSYSDCIDDEIFAVGIALLAKENTLLGRVYWVRSEDANDAACALHRAYGLDRGNVQRASESGILQDQSSRHAIAVARSA